ncbi:hypothetical protein QEN19_002761 [Hanseniaspora menglaensis]
MESSSAPGQYKAAYKKYNRWNKWNNKNKETGDGNDYEGAGSTPKSALLSTATSKKTSYKSEKAASTSSPSSSASANAGSAKPEASFDLGKNKRVTVRQFRNVNLIDIREYYKDTSGELKPGKKGISLTEEMFDSLLMNYRNIDDALRRLGSDRVGALESTAFNNITAADKNIANSAKKNNTDDSNTAGSLVIDNSGTVAKNSTSEAENALPGSKRKNADLAAEAKSKNKKAKEAAVTPAPPQKEQQKRVEEQESRANLVIPTKPPVVAEVAKKEEVDSDDDFANDLENELAN